MVKQTARKINQRVMSIPRKYHMLIVSVILVFLVLMHYHEAFANVRLLDQINSFFELGLTRQTFGRILFLVPILYGAAILGIGAGISILIFAAVAMLPRVFLLSPVPGEALFETMGIIFTGALIISLINSLNKDKSRFIELESVRKMLNIQVERLSMLHALSSTVSQSLKLTDILSAVDMSRQLTKSRASWLYLYDEDEKLLRLATFKGLSESALPQKVTLGEGPDGEAAESRQLKIIDKLSATAAFSQQKRQEELQSMIIVPLIAKDELVGTLGIGSSLGHSFSQDEVDLFRATADQFCMALVNARLYEKEQTIAEALRVSERNYRELFESASDAIWVHDLDGKILEMNKAFERLTGYDRNILSGANVSMLLSAHGRSQIDKETHETVLSGGTAEPHEEEMVRKDKSAAIIEIGTSLITKNGQPWAFQHIARDITEQKKAQDNLRFYVQQVNQAQEAERKRIARELHDVTLQALITIVRNLDDLDSGHSHYSIKEIQEQVRGILKEIRRFSQQLRPSILDDLGLLPAIKWLAGDITKNYGIKIDIKVTGEPRPLPSDTELVVFRITQEALNNVQRHSGAKEAEIEVDFNSHVTRVTVNDNGKGFVIPERIGDLARSGRLGLAGMQERAQLLGGNLTINSEPGKGTRLTIEVKS